MAVDVVECSLSDRIGRGTQTTVSAVCKRTTQQPNGGGWGDKEKVSPTLFSFLLFSTIPASYNSSSPSSFSSQRRGIIMPPVPLELVALASMGLKKVSSPLFLLLFVQNLLLILTILILGCHKWGEGRHQQDGIGKVSKIHLLSELFLHLSNSFTIFLVFLIVKPGLIPTD